MDLTTREPQVMVGRTVKIGEGIAYLETELISQLWT